MKHLVQVAFAVLLGVASRSGAQPAVVTHPKWTRNAVIYEVNVRQYTPEGTFAALDRKLPHMDSLGVDILWLMPVQPIGKKNRKGPLGSYYSISNYTAINPEFGSAADLREFITDAHRHGKKIVLDWVANHTSFDHVWIARHPDWYVRDAAGNEVVLVTRNSYVAIAGAVDRLDAAGQFRETRNTDSTSWSIDFGITAWGGMIVPDYSHVTFTTVPDGLSNTMMISEQSDYVSWIDPKTGATMTSDYAATSTGGGLYRGHEGSAGRDKNGNLSKMTKDSDGRGQTFTTIRYQINQKTGWKPAPNVGVINDPNINGRWMSEGANVPLVSAHSGGVNALFGDGSVHFLNNSTDLLTLARLATRDDGGVVSIDQ